jgi:pimeloyl-ACP methyl ester carboxylesterase
MYEELEKINAANNSKSASDWIGAWSKTITDPPNEAEVERMHAAAIAAEEERLAEARFYRYVYVQDLLSGSGDSFAGKYLADALGTIDIELETPDLVCGDAEYTVTSALEKLTATLNVEEGRKERPVRLIGSSTGALVAALYAEKNRGRVDKVFLLAPTWGLANILPNFETRYGITFSKAFVDDASNLPDYPTVTCPAYVVHGHDDDVSPLANSARWMQMASQWMRQEGDSDENVAERRLLEVSGLGHGVETALPMSMGRFTEFFKIPRVDLFLREREP